MVGFPHSEIPGSKPVRGSPRLIAAYYVLHRLHAPRHPLDALKALDRSHYRCPQLLAVSCNHGRLSSGRTIAASENDAAIFDRSDQKTKIHVLQLIFPGLWGRAIRCASLNDVERSGGGAFLRNGSGQTLLLRCDVSISGGWWSQTGSNRRPHACKARALPTELWPRRRATALWRGKPIDRACPAVARSASEGWWARVDSNYRPHAYQACALTT
jgi:hypothetical protein